MSFILGGKGAGAEKSSTQESHSSYASYIASGVKINGSVAFESGKSQEAVCLECEVEGEISSSGRLIIGGKAVIKANISGEEITVFGAVEGDITASKRLVLKNPAKVKGNIKTPLLTVEEGVVFQGSCAMDNGQGKVISNPLKRTAELVK